MHTRFLAGAVAASLLLPAFALADSDLSINSKGALKASGLVVVQRSGSNLFTRAVWGNAYVRVTVLVGAATAVTKKYGESAVVGDIAVGHLLDVEGTLSSGADSLIIQATSVRDMSLTKESKSISGTVKAKNAGEYSIVIPNASLGDTTVVLTASTPIKKGERQIQFADLAVGDRILSASGTYDYGANRLTANAVEVHQDAAMFRPRNFEGSLKSVAGASPPTTLVVTVDGADLTVHLNAEALVLNKARAATSLKRFAEGDTVRFYGAIRKDNFSEVDAEVVRDLNF